MSDRNNDDYEIITGDDKSSLNLAPNITAVLAYVGMVVTGIIFLMIEKKNKFVRFHAMQSVCFFGAIWIMTLLIGWIPFIGWLVSGLISLVTVVGWVFLMYKAYNNEYYKLPVVGDLAEDFVKKV